MVGEQQRLAVMGFAEHFIGRAKRVRRGLGVAETEEERDEVEGLLGSEWQWMERCRLLGGKGGVGLAVRRSVGVGVVMDAFCSEGMLWVRVDLRSGGELYVGVVYLVPEGSVYGAEALAARECLSAGLHHICGVLGATNVVVMGDVNGRIGERSLWFDDPDGDEVVEVKRVSDDKVMNARGEEVVGLLEAHHVMLLNGVDGDESGAATCRGVSVVDWVAVRREMKVDCSPLRVEPGWIGGGGGWKGVDDHGWLRFDWKVVGGEGVEEGGECVDAGAAACGRGGGMRGKCRVRRGWADQWRGVQRECERVFRPWCEEGVSGDATRDAASWLQAYEVLEVVRGSVGWSRAGMKDGGVSWRDREIDAWNGKMRKMMIEWMNEPGGRDAAEVAWKKREWRREKQKRIRRARTGRMMEKMREIERLGRVGGDSLLRALREWSGKKSVLVGGDRLRMRGDDGEWIMGDEMKRKWRQTFESVGQRLEAEEGFDDGVKTAVEAVVDGLGDCEVADEEKVEIDCGVDRHETTMNGDVMRWEVDRAVKKMKSGKAAGVDGVVAELLKHGGVWMMESLWRLCATVFRGEKVPLDWLRAIKVPVKKKGRGDRYDEYRGVTLLSVVGKVFGRVIETRLRAFCESRGVLVDCQFGGRQGRACRDALFVVSELMERRGEGERVFMGFLDIAKAYPSVWRKGMWFKLWEVGVRGRLWRVVKSLYARYESAVRVGGVADDWYDEFVGLREGCVLSPLLFAIYINGLSRALDDDGCGGVRVGGVVVRCLMFVDDVVMVASSVEGLQRMFDVVAAYGRRWRFKYNFGPNKTAVMVCGGVRAGEGWVLGGIEIPVVVEYKYLGVTLTAGRARWKLRRGELLAKARGAFWRAWGLGMEGGFLSAKAARGLWGGLVGPVVEYASEIDSGVWEEVEVMQRMAGRMCLGVGKSVPNAVVMGDLGWWPMRARREYLRLAYWGKLARGEVSGVVRGVYWEGRRRMGQGMAGKGEWCVETKRLLCGLGLGEVWLSGRVGSDRQWKALVRALVHEREEMRWRRELASKSTLARYARIKDRLVPEWWLGESRVWVRRWVKLRASASCLEVTTGRYRGVARAERVCRWCKGGYVEDEEHFLDGCKWWRKERRPVWDAMRVGDESYVKKVEGWTRVERVDWMLMGGCSVRTREILLREVGRWLFRRERYGKVAVAAREAEMRALAAMRKARRMKRVHEAQAAAAMAAVAAAFAAAPAAKVAGIKTRRHCAEEARQRVRDARALTRALAGAGALVAARAV